MLSDVHFHPSLTDSTWTTLLVSWWDDGFHFFSAPPEGVDALILLDAYYASYLISFIASLMLGLYWVRKGGVVTQRHQVYDLVLVSILGVMIGAKIAYVLFYNLEYYLQNPWEIILNWSGMASHGAVVGAFVAIALYCRRARIPLFEVTDHAGICACFGALFVRFANFLNAELFGRSIPSWWPYAYRFPIRDGLGRPLFVDSRNQIYVWLDGQNSKFQKLEDLPNQNWESFSFIEAELPQQIFSSDLLTSSGEPLRLARLITDPRHPVQFYELVLAGLGLMAFLFWLKAQKPTRGVLTAAFLMGYGLIRIFIEFLRQPDPQRSSGIFSWISLGQMLSLAMLLGGFLLYRAVKKKEASAS